MKNQNRTHKTAAKNRGIYRYSFQDGPEVVIRPEDLPEGEMWIKFLHAQDDSEVYFNLKNQKLGGEWAISINQESELKENEPLQIVDENVMRPFDETNNQRVERMREIVETLPEIQQIIYRLIYIEGYSNSEASMKVFGDKEHESSIRYHIGKIKEKIRKEF